MSGASREDSDRLLEARRPGFGGCALLFTAYLGALLSIYAPALSGPFVSDDMHYVAENPYVHSLSVENAVEIFDPFGASTVAVVNYSPVQLLLHGAAWRLFGDQVVGHHVLNLALHAVASVLLMLLLCASGVPLGGALVGSLFFLMHPANVEAVAWISQLKTIAGLVFTLLALLAYPRRPALGFAFFVLGLLNKATAAVALPVAFLIEWARTGRVRVRHLAIWCAALAVYAWIEISVHQHGGAAEATLYVTPFVLLRTMAALALRYLVMAVSSWGVSVFHEPEPAYSILDPWWLLALPTLGLVAWRLVALSRAPSAHAARKEEAIYWFWALASFAPVSQIFPFLYPFADRYLYFMLPGLIGVSALMFFDAVSGLAPLARSRIYFAAMATLLALCGSFAWRSHERAAIWRSPATLVADAARHYPSGVSANLLRAKRAARSGDVDASIAGIRAAMARGYNRYEQLLADPGFESIRDEPAFMELIREIAGSWIDAGRQWKNPTQGELRMLASAHAVRGERDEAIALLRRALEIGGPFDAAIRADLSASVTR